MRISEQTSHGSRPVAAVLLMVGSAASFALMGAAVKASTGSLPFLVSLFFRSILGIIPLGIIVIVRQGSLRSNRQMLLFRRSLLGFCAMFMFFFAIEHLPLSTAVVLNQSAPVFTVIFSAILLKEHKAIHILPLSIIAFAGVGVLVGPDIANTGIEASIGLASAVLSALAYVTVKQLSVTESSPLIVFYFSVWGTLFAAVVLGLAMLTGWGNLDLHLVASELSRPAGVVALCLVGFFGVCGQLLMTASYARARASVVSPFAFFNPLFSYVIGVSVFAESVTLHGVLGGLLVVSASAMVPFVSNRSARSR